MYLIDTSVWIHFFNSPESKSALFLESLLDDNNTACINAIIEMEILQGIRGDRQFETVKSYLADFQYFPSFSRDYFLDAANIYRKCRRKGVTVRKSLDCLIAANCMRDGLIAVHVDRDFENIRQVFRSFQTLAL